MQDQYIAKLIHCKSLDEFVTMFFGLSMCEKLSVLGDDVPVPKGTIFYRARKDEGRPLEDENEWWLPPPKMVTKGRFNKEKSPVLYLGTEDFLLPREIGLKPNENYYLARYECVETFKVGSLLKNRSIITMGLHKIAMAIENEGKLTPNEIDALSKLECDTSNICNILGDPTAVFYINKYIHKNLYDITNQIFDLVLQRNPNGLRYCSAYSPFEVSGAEQVITLDGCIKGNYALTEDGIQHLKWIGCERKEYSEDDYKSDLSTFIKIAIENYS